MRQSNIFKKIFRLQAHLLKRKRTHKWIQKRIYYNKRERILIKDINLFEGSLCLKAYVDRLKKLQDNIYKNIRDPVQQKKQKVFQKLRFIDLIIKIRHIITGLKTRYLEQKLKNKIKLPSQQILRWLTKYFKNSKDIEYLNKYPSKIKQRVYNAISTLSKQRVFVPEGQNYISAEQWYRKFITECRPYVNQQLANSTFNKFDQPYLIVIHQESQNNMEENELEIFNNSQGTIEIHQNLKEIPRRGKIIEKMMVKLQHQFQQEKQRKMIEKPQKVISNTQNKVLRLKKPRCPVPECKKQLSVRKCPDSNHMITICEECHWNEHNCVDMMPGSYLQQMDIVAKGERIRNFTLVRLPKTEIENNVKQTLKKLNYEYTDKIKILPGTPQKIICSYPILAFNTYTQILKNRQEQCFLPLTIKQSVIEGAGLGVFATVDIKKIGTLICSYLGEIGIGSRTPVLSKNAEQQKINDSIFTLGWIEKQLLLMIPNNYTNIGRFINYNEPNLCNLKPSLCLIEKEVNKYEIAVFLTTTKQILKGEQLYYNYGNEYNL